MLGASDGAVLGPPTRRGSTRPPGVKASASSRSPKDWQEAMRTSWLSELSGPTTPALLAAEAQSVRYWRTNALAFRDRVLDGFYEPHGLFPEVCAPEHFPHLSALMRVIPQRQPEASILRREVILVDRRRDKHLQAMAAEAAEAVARARGPDEIGSPTRRSGASGGSADNKAAAPANKAAPAAVEPTPIADSLPCYQALAHVVAGHMGGTLDSQPAAAEQWCAMINQLKGQSASVVVPIGLLHMGAARHRALLYKVLADDLGMPCRILKGRRLPDNDSDNARVVISCGGQQLYIDLLARPGEVSPVPDDAHEDAGSPRAAVQADAAAAQPALVPGDGFGSSFLLPPPLPHLADSPPQSSGRRRSNSISGGGRLSVAAGALRPPQLTDEERALLAALDSPGSDGGAPLVRPVGLPASVTMQPQRTRRQAEVPVTRSSADQQHAAAAADVLASQHTLPAALHSELGLALAAAAHTAASTSPQQQSTSASSHSSLPAPLDLSHAVSLEHALHLAAAAAMDSGSLLLPGSDGRGSRDSGSHVGSRPSSVTAASHSSIGLVSRASTGHESLGRWDSQPLGLEGQPARSSSLAGSGRHRSGALSELSVGDSLLHSLDILAEEGTAPLPTVGAADAAPPAAVPRVAANDGDGMASPFGAASAFSPFGAFAFPLESPAEEEEEEEAEEEEVEENIDEGVTLGAPFSFKLQQQQALQQFRHEAEDALIEDALNQELGPAAGIGGGATDDAGGGGAAGSAGRRLARLAAALPPLTRQQAQRAHSLRSLGEFEGISTIYDLNRLVAGTGTTAAAAKPSAAVAQLATLSPSLAGPFPAVAALQPPELLGQAALQQHVTVQQEQQVELQFGSPLPSVRVSDGPASVRQSGAAALEALEHLQTQQGQLAPGWQGYGGEALPLQPQGVPRTDAAGPFWAQHQAGPPTAAGAGATPFLAMQQQLRQSPARAPSPHRHPSSGMSLELGPAHLEVDERTGQAFLVQPVRAASEMSLGAVGLGSQLSGDSSSSQPSTQDSMMDLVEALRMSGILDGSSFSLHLHASGRVGAPAFASAAPSGAASRQATAAQQLRTFSEPLLHQSSGGSSAAGALGDMSFQRSSCDFAPAAAAAAAAAEQHPSSGAASWLQALGPVGGMPVTQYEHRRSIDMTPPGTPWQHAPAGSPWQPAPPGTAPPRLSVPIEWERLQGIRSSLRNGSGGGSGHRSPSPEPAGIQARRSNSSGDPGAVPFGAGIPEGGPYNPAAAVPHGLEPSPFSGSMQQQQAGMLYSLYAPGGHGVRRSDNSSLTGSTAENTSSMHSTTSEGAAAAASMAGIMLEGLEEWEIQPDEIVLGPRIGIGSFGEVYRGIWRQTDVAVKRLLDQEVSQQMLFEFRQEISIMKRLRHPHIVQFLGAVTQPPHLCIVTQFVPRGSLFKLLHRTPAFNPDERRRLQMALDIARGMNFLHTCKPPIIHRDLKSPNLLVDKDLTVKVCDFGLSRARRSTMMSTKSQAGTPEWTAPEVLQSRPYNEKCDIYSYGVILWELFSNEEPWHDKSPMQVVGAVGWNKERLPVPVDVPPAMRDLIEACFGEPQGRPSFSDIIPRLKQMIKALGPPPGYEPR